MKKVLAKNLLYILGTIISIYLLVLMAYFQLWGANELTYFNHPTLRLPYSLVIVVLSLGWLFSPLISKEKFTNYIHQTGRYLMVLIPLQVLVLVMPFGKFWICQFSGFFQLFVLGIGLSIWLYWVMINPFIKSKLYLKSKKVNWNFLPWLLVGLGFLVYGTFTLIIFYNLYYPIKDVGVFDQAIWHYSKFQIPASSLQNFANLEGDHFHPILALIAPLYWLKSDVRVLLIFQALMISLGAWPIYQISLLKLKDKFLSFSFAFGWLFFLGIQYAIAFGFYPETLAITFLAFAIYFILKNRNWLYLLFVFLALLCKENISLYVFALSVYFVLFEKRKVGIVSGFISLVWFIMAPKIITAISGQYQYFYYIQLGNNFFDVLKTIIIHPIYSLKILIYPVVKVNTMFFIFLPVVFLPFFTPFFIVLLPNLAEKFLSSNPMLWQIVFHYGAGISTFLFVGAIYGLEKILRKNYFRNLSINMPVFIGILLLVMNLLLAIDNQAPLNILTKKSFYKNSYNLEMQQALEQIPQDASVSVQDKIGLTLAHRNKIYLWDGFTFHSTIGEYIFLSNQSSIYPLTVTQYQAAVREAVGNQGYGVYYYNDHHLILRKNENNKNLPANWVDQIK